jgi:hypothetical protein
MNQPLPLPIEIEPVPHSRFLPPLRALIGAMDEFVFSGEIDSVLSGSMACGEMFHGRELSSALDQVLAACSPSHPQYRQSTCLECAICLDLKNLAAPLLEFWSYICHSTNPGRADRGWRKMFGDQFAIAKNDVRRFVTVLETGRWEVEGE